jgi:hypothetical protein
VKTHDYVHHYRGYWSDGGKCRIRIYQEDGGVLVSSSRRNAKRRSTLLLLPLPGAVGHPLLHKYDATWQTLVNSMKRYSPKYLEGGVLGSP